MWVIRQYSTSDDELRQHLDLREVSAEELRETLGFEPTPYGSTPLTLDLLRALAERYRFAVPVDGEVEYFLDFDAEPTPHAWERDTAVATAT